MQGGVGQSISAGLEKRCYLHGIEGFVHHGKLEELYTACGFDADTILGNIENRR